MVLPSASEFDPHRPPSQTVPKKRYDSLPSWGLAPLRRVELREATNIGLTWPDCAAPSNFLSFLTLCSARSPPAFFHAGNAHGVHPSEVFSSPIAETNLVDCSAPPDVAPKRSWAGIVTKKKAEAVLRSSLPVVFMSAASLETACRKAPRGLRACCIVRMNRRLIHTACMLL